MNSSPFPLHDPEPVQFLIFYFCSQSGDNATIGIVVEPISTPYPGVYHRQYIVVNVVPGSDAAKQGIQVRNGLLLFFNDC